MAILPSDLLVGDEGIGHAQKRKIGRWLAAPFLFHDRAGSATLFRLLDKFVPVEIVTAQGHKKIARLQSARIRAETVHQTAPLRVLQDSPGKLRDLI